MISFIVIGRNEAKNIKRCIQGIYNAIQIAGIQRYEIIYVDSKSTDRSLEMIECFTEVKVYSVTGERNAAVGRNIGAREASGTVYYFIDADMEIDGKFLKSIYNNATGDIEYPFVSGNLIDVIGNEEIKRSSNKLVSGGIFLIRADLWKKVGGMRTKFTAGEDYDLSLRMLENGYRFKRKKEIITKHYTIANLHKSRLWRGIKTKYSFFPRCVLLREHFFTKETYTIMFQNEKTFMLLIASIVALFINVKIGIAGLILYVLGSILRSILNRKHMPVINMTSYFIVADLLNLVYFFTFFPKPVEEKYIRIR